MRTPKLALASLTAIAALAVFAGGAQAAQRYAAPKGVDSGNCPQAAPCNLNRAVGKAESGDEVIVETGTYSISGTVTPENPEIANLFIHGDFGAPMPVIDGTGTFTSVLSAYGKDLRISWLDVRTSDPMSTALTCAGKVDRVRASAGGEYGVAIEATDGCDLSNSLAVSSGSEGSGISATASYTSSASFTNDTAIATGAGGFAIYVSYVALLEEGTTTVAMTNTIARGTGGDLGASGLGVSSKAKLVVSYSNFGKATVGENGEIVEGPGNQKAVPVFVNSAAGDYGEAAGSPTIEAGLLGPNVGSLDLAGDPRTQGGTVDIGAFEFASPPPPPVIPPAIGSLKVAPVAFRAAGSGGAVASAKGKGKAKGPMTAKVSYSLNVAASVTFSVEKKVVGRKAGKKCVKKTKANTAKAKCPLYKPVKGSFSHSGAAGANSFKFTGRVDGKALKPGAYRLTGKAGATTRVASFRIVK